MMPSRPGRRESEASAALIFFRFLADMRRISPVALAFFFWTGTSRADEADTVTARLEWNRAEGAERCLSAEGLREAVNQRWGRAVITDSDHADLLLVGRIGPRGRRTWTAKLEMRRENGESLGSRLIVTRAPDCSSLDESVTLAAGLMLDISKERVSDERAQVPTPAAKVVAGPSIQVPRETPAARAPWHADVFAGGEASLWLLPEPALGFRFGVAAEPPRFWRVEAAATLWSTTEKTRNGLGARFDAWTAEFAVCPFETAASTPTIRGCILQRLGQIRAEGIGFAASARPEESLVSLGARAGADWPFTRYLALLAGIRAELPLVRYRFVYEDASRNTRAVHEMAWGTLGVDVALALRF